MFVREWRVEAEERAMAAGRAGMGRERITAFVDAFLPAYALWTPGLRECPPTSPPHLHVIVGRDRLPTEVLTAWQHPALHGARTVRMVPMSDERRDLLPDGARGDKRASPLTTDSSWPLGPRPPNAGPPPADDAVDHRAPRRALLGSDCQPEL